MAADAQRHSQDTTGAANAPCRKELAVSFFSCLHTEGEMNQLLDKLYGDAKRDPKLIVEVMEALAQMRVARLARGVPYRCSGRQRASRW